jgi:prepilin-type N-terminal cleavage/methylation domain-containing protein
MLNRMRSENRTGRADGGFTLVELLISVAILGLVMTAISGAMAVGLKTTKDSGDRLGASNDVQFASTWFGDDVAGANDVVTGGAAQCGTDTSVVVQFLNRDQNAPTARPTALPSPSPTPAPVSLTVTYALRTVTKTDGTFKELHRVACKTSGSATDNIVARRLSATAAVPTPTISGKTVTVTLTPGDAGASPFTLRGTRRAQ